MKKILLIGLCIMFLLVTGVSGALTDNNQMYWSFDQDNTTGTTMIDLADNYNGTCYVFGSACNTIIGGKILNGTSFASYGNSRITSSYGSGLTTDSFSTSIWIYPSDIGSETQTFLGTLTGTTGRDGIYAGVTTGGNLRVIGFDNNVAEGDILGTTTLSNGQWYNIIINYETNNLSVFLNGSLEASDTSVTIDSHDGNFLVGNVYTSHSANDWEGRLDEFAVWNKTLTATERSDLWNNSYGRNFYNNPITPPLVNDTLNLSETSPVNNTNITYTTSTSFTATINSTGAWTCKLYINGSYTGVSHGNTGLNPDQPVLLQYNFYNNIGDGEWEWYMNCYNALTTENSTIKTIYVDTNSPTSNITYTNQSIYFNNNMTGQFNFSDSLLLHTAQIYIDGSIYLLNLTNIGAKTFNYSLNYNTSSFSPGDHNLTVYFADGHTAEVLMEPEAYNPKNGLFNDYLKYKFQKPYKKDTLLIEHMNGSIFDTFTTEYNGDDRYIFNFEPNKKGTSYTFNVETDEKIYIYNNDEFGGDWVVFGEHWLDFYLPTQPNQKVKVKRISDYNVEVTVSGIDPTLELLTFNSVGDLNTVTLNYDFGVVNASVGYYPEVFDISTTTINLTINTSSSFVNSTSASLYWNNTLQTVTKTSGTDYDFYTSNVTIPEVNTNENVTFYWDYNIIGDNNNESGNLTYNQSILKLDITDCSSGIETLNMTIYDEDSPTSKLITGVEIDGTIWTNSSGAVKDVNFDLSGSNSYVLCITPNDSSVQTDMYIKYTTSNGFTHRYYLVNHTLSNVTTYLSMYNFNNISGVSNLKLTARDKLTYNYYSNVIGKLQRLYVSEGVWRTVQMDESGDYGQLFYNIIEENTDYRIIFMDRDNNILEQTETMKFVCDGGSCEIIYLLTPYSESTIGDNISITQTFNNATMIYNITWSDPAGDNLKFKTIVNWQRMDGMITVCNQTTQAASGSQICNLTGYDGTFLVRVHTSKSPWTYQSAEWLTIKPGLIGDVVGYREGLFWTFAICLTIVMIGLFSPVGAMVALILGLIITFFMGFVNVITVTMLLVVGILTIFVGVKLRT